MKFLIPVIFSTFTAHAFAAEVPKIFGGLFEQNVAIKGEIGVVLPPQDINKYISKVESAARKDPKWFREYSGSSKPGAPLPYDERLGLTKTEYEEYLVLWSKREFKPMEEVMLMLRQSTADTWSITSTGGASSFSTLRYVPKEDLFRSPNGDLKRIGDIKADPSSILGEWTGSEWKFDADTGLGKMKENFAIGTMKGNKYGLLVYRAQELSSEGTRLLDKSLIVRFPLGSSGKAKVPAKKP